MPDSPKIWGTQELGKQSTAVETSPWPLPPRPQGGKKHTQSPGAAPRRACTAHQWEINPSIHHIKSDWTNTILPEQRKLNC